MEQFPRLSNREQEVVNLLRQGKSNKVIASSLNISERTVEFHLRNIYDKFQVGSRVELVLKLGESTVVPNGEVAENGDNLNSQNWATHLSNGATSLREAVSGIGKELKVTTILKANELDSNEANEGKMMTFGEAIRVCLIKYATFSGRATRPEFWWFALFVILVAGALTYLSEAWASIFLVAMLLPFLAAGTRRLHDIGKSGWWNLFILVPAAGFILMGILWAIPTTNELPTEKLPE